MIEVASAAVTIQPDFAGFSPALQRGIQTSAQQTAAAASRLGGAISAAVTVPVTAIGVGAVRAFASFDDALTQSIAIMGDAGDALREELAAGARQVARETTVSATQAAESYFFLASAGLSAENSLAALPTVARFAQAGMFDMATATDLATDAQSALGLTVRDDAVANLENLTRVTDVLVKGNILANASVEQFATALTNRAGAALRLVNKDVEEGVAVLAAFPDQGIKGEEAGTRLDIVLRDLQTKALENASAFKRFGISVFDSNGNVRNMADILEDLERAFEGANDETKRATLLTLGFSDRSVASLLSLIGTSEQIRIYEAALREAGGTTQEVADRQLRSLTAQLTIAKNRITDAGITLGEQFAPAVVAAAEGIATLVEGFTALPGPVRQAIIVTAALTALAGPLLLVGGRIAQSILALQTLTAAQGVAARSALGLASAEAAAATGIGAAGAAAARNAPLIAGAAGAAGGAAAGVGLGGVAAGAGAGSLAAFGLNTTRSAIVRRGGIGGLLAGATRAGVGRGLLRGVGIQFATELGAGLVQGIQTQEGTIGDQVKDTTANALRFGGLGAGIGTVVAPGLGTAIGAGLGAIAGSAIGFFRSSGAAAAVADEAATDIGTAFAEAVDDLSDRQAGLVSNAIAQLVDAAVEDGVARGLTASEAGRLGDVVEEILVAGVREGVDPNTLASQFDVATVAAITRGFGTAGQVAAIAARGAAIGDGLGTAIAEAAVDAADFAFGGAFATGTAPADVAAFRAAEFASAIEDALSDVRPAVSFGDAFTEAFEGGESIVASIRAGAAASGEQLDLGFVTDQVVASISTVPSIFSDVFGEARTVATSEIETLVAEQAVKFAAFEENLRTIAGAGLFALADQIRQAGPSAAAEAQAVADSLTAGDDAPFRIEGTLRGLAGDGITAFLAEFENATPEDKATAFVNRFVSPFETELNAPKAKVITEAWMRGLGEGITSRTRILLAQASALGTAIGATTRASLGISSPSRVGMSIGRNFVAGINAGIERAPIATPDLTDPASPVPGVGGDGASGDSFAFTIVNPEPRPAETDVVRALALTRTVGLLRGGRR